MIKLFQIFMNNYRFFLNIILKLFAIFKIKIKIMN